MRQPQPFFRKQTQSWYVQIGSKQVPLGKDLESAQRKYHQLMAGQIELSPDTPVVAVLDEFLEWVKNNQADTTYAFYSRFLTEFAESIGTQAKAAELKPYHVTRWVDSRYAGQSDSTKHGAYRSVERAFNWAKKQGILKHSPVEGMEKPTPGRRETYLTPDQFKIVLAKVAEYERGEGGPFYELLVALWDTGCRPQEVRTVEARHFDPQRGIWIFERKLSKGKKRRRVVYLTDRMREISARLVAQFPEGPLFRNGKGKPWTKAAINCRFRHLTGAKKGKRQKKNATPLGFPVHAYAFRHGFATDRLQNGVDSTTVATLLGHTSTRMLETVYQHVDANDTYLRSALPK